MAPSLITYSAWASRFCMKWWCRRMVQANPDSCSSFSTWKCHRPIGALEWAVAAKADTFTTCFQDMVELQHNAIAAAPSNAAVNVSGRAKSPATHVMPGRVCAFLQVAGERACGDRRVRQQSQEFPPDDASSASHENHRCLVMPVWS